MKIVFQVAGGILLALFALFLLNIAVAVSPAAGSFFAVLLKEPGFWLMVLLAIAAVVAVHRYDRRRRGSTNSK